MYREVRDAGGAMGSVGQHLRAAILAEDTRAMSEEAAAAMAITSQTLDSLKSATEHEAEGDVDARFMQAAIASLNLAWTNAEKVGLGTNVTDMRARVLDFKTDVDYAVAYLRASIGGEEV